MPPFWRTWPRDRISPFLAAMRNVLVLCPQDRDRKAVTAAGLDSRYRVIFGGEDLDRIERLRPGRVPGRVRAGRGRCDRRDEGSVRAPGRRSSRRAAVWPGPSPRSVLACQHKPTSRAIQRAVAPESTPAVALLGRDEPLPLPYLRQAERGAAVTGGVRVETEADVPAPATDLYAERHAAIAAQSDADVGDLHGLVAEELLEGVEVTVEGFVHERPADDRSASPTR